MTGKNTSNTGNYTSKEFKCQIKKHTCISFENFKKIKSIIKICIMWWIVVIILILWLFYKMKIYYSRCTEKGGGSNLVSLHSQAENEFVAGLLPMVCAFTCFKFLSGRDKALKK